MTWPIVVLGSLNMDLVLNVPRAAAVGETVLGRTLTFVSGGKGANQAVAGARLGGRVAMVGRVGADNFGEQLRQELIGNGVNVEHVQTAAGATGVALILVDDLGQNRITVIPGANQLLMPAGAEQAAALIDQATLLLTQLEVPLATVEWAIDRAAGTGVRVLLNPAPVQGLSERMWSKIDYMIPNETEASILTNIDVHDVPSATLAAREIRRRGVRHVLITLGAKGVLIEDDRGTRTYPAPNVEAVDTTGAGDTFIGALAVALVEGRDLDASARFAIEAASLSVTRHGAQSSIPYRDEIDAHRLTTS